MKRQVPAGKTFPYFAQISRFIGPYIVDWLSVEGDGNCGYRSISKQVYETEDAWVHVKIDLVQEIGKRIELYKHACILNKVNDIEDFIESVWHFKSEPAPYEKWMSGNAIGLVVATCYQMPFVIFSSPGHPFTTLPLVSTTDTPMCVSRVDPEIVIGYLHESSHYIWLNMRSGCLLPPIHQQWFYHHDSGTVQFANSLSSRLSHYQSLLPRTPAKNVTLDD